MATLQKRVKKVTIVSESEGYFVTVVRSFMIVGDRRLHGKANYYHHVSRKRVVQLLMADGAVISEAKILRHQTR